jgi:hypothetical protein
LATSPHIEVQYGQVHAAADQPLSLSAEEEQREPDAEGGARGDAGEDHVPHGRGVAFNGTRGNLESVAGSAAAW